MRFIVTALLAFLTLLLSAGPACAYTFLLDVREDRLEIKQGPMERGESLFGYGDLTIRFQARGMGGRQWRLYILAIDDMRGASVVPASEIRWQALSRNLYDGKLVKGVPQILAEGTGDVNMMSRLRFTFDGNNYEAGYYDSQIRFILSSP